MLCFNDAISIIIRSISKKDIEVLAIYFIKRVYFYLCLSLSALNVNVDCSYYNQLLSDLNLNMPKPTLDKIFNSYCNKEVRSPLILAIKSLVKFKS